jgi:hypothetical protein
MTIIRGEPVAFGILASVLHRDTSRRDVKSFKMKTKDGLIDVGKLFAKVRALSS